MTSLTGRVVLTCAATLLTFAPFVGPITSAEAATGSASIAGTITADDTGLPIPGACVTVWEKDMAAYGGNNCADDTGHYSVDGLVAGTSYIVQVADSGEYLGEWAQNGTDSSNATAYPAPATVNVGLARGVSLSGTVHNLDGTPANGASVSAQTPDGSGFFNAYTAADGTYRMFVRPADYRVQFWLADGTNWYAYGTTDINAAALIHVAAGAPVTVNDTAPKPTLVTGKVVEAGTKVPLSGICVGVAAPSDLATRYGGGPDSCSKADGSYSLTVDPNTWVAVAIDDTGAHAYASSSPFTITQGQTRTINLAMPVAGSLTGKVVDRITGTPITGVCPSAYSGRDGGYVIGQTSTCTDSLGQWTVKGLRPEQVSVNIGGDATHIQRWAADAPTQAAATLYPVTRGKTATVATVKLYHGGTLTGRITDGKGHPVTGAWVQFGGAFNSRVGAGGGGAFPTAQTDATGRYTIRNIPESAQPVEVYTVQGTGYAWQFSGNAADVTAATKITVRFNQTSTFNAALQPEATLRVNVTGVAGRDAMLDAFTPSGTPIGWSADALTDGPQVLTGLPTSRIKLRITVASMSGTGTPTVFWYDGATSAGTATKIAVTSGKQTTIKVRIAK